MDCLFCKMITGNVPAKIVYRDDLVLAVNDINPQAPIHLLIIPQKHIGTLNEVGEGDSELIGHMIEVATKLAKELKIDETGYRVVLNCNQDGGQSVFHIHAHIMGGRKLNWPPG